MQEKTCILKEGPISMKKAFGTSKKYMTIAYPRHTGEVESLYQHLFSQDGGEMRGIGALGHLTYAVIKSKPTCA